MSATFNIINMSDVIIITQKDEDYADAWFDWSWNGKSNSNK